LEKYPDLHPLTPEGEIAERILRKLRSQGTRLPLVVASAEEGAFRVSVAYWVGGGKVEAVSTYDDLERCLQAWDGSVPDLRLWREAHERGLQEARNEVAVRREQVERRWQEGLRRQVEAARYRLERELLRLLCAVDGRRDPNMVWHELMREAGERARWLQEAAQRLGYPYRWTAEQVSEARQWVQAQPVQRQETLRLGSSLQAALQDPRWKSRQPAQASEAITAAGD
ncbi:MAG: hypothetical protein NZ741_11610, partial [Armatimonadetes bacterium]|nr:hypothetical protein [Armatimonadota bacterium]